MWHDPSQRTGLLASTWSSTSCTVVALDRRPEAPAGSHRALRGQERVPQGHPQLRSKRTPGRALRARRGRRRSPSRPATPRCCPSPTTDGGDPRHAARARRRAAGPAAVQAGEDRAPTSAATRSCSTTARSSLAAITSCTNTSNPSVMIGARACSPRRPWRRASRPSRGSRPTMAPGSQGRHRLLRQGRPDGRTWRSWASSWSATAAPPASATPGPLPDEVSAAINDHDLARDRGALRQPQLRGPHQPRREDELSRRRRRWSSPTRWPARWTSTSRPSRSARTPTATTCS